MKRLFGLAVLVLAALTFTLASCQNETKDDKPTAYTVTIASTIENGTVTANKTSAVKGDTVKLTATPDNGWQLSAYSVTDENGNDITVTEGIFTMPASNVTVSATFTKTEATLNQEAADAVIAKINAIGTVAYTAESKTKIDEARSAYDALTTAQKALISAETLAVLTTAESTYESLIIYIGSKKPSKAKAVGDIIFSDGSALPAEEISSITEEQKAKAVAVIFYAGTGAATRGSNENILGAKTLGVGIHNTNGETTQTYRWAQFGTTGYTTMFGDKQNIQLKSSTTAPAEGTLYYQYKYSNTTYYATGDFDGSDNWSKLCEYDTEGTAVESVATNYPAFNWVNNYTNTYNLTGELANYWYLPSGVELLIMYDNKTSVNASLEAAGGTKIEDTDYWSSAYWSSSQYTSGNGYAMDMFFKDGGLKVDDKNASRPVCAIRAF